MISKMVEDSITCGKRTFKFQHLPCLGRSPVDEDRKNWDKGNVFVIYMFIFSV